MSTRDDPLQTHRHQCALNHLIDHEIDLSGFDARYGNDLTGAPAYPPAMLLKVVRFGYSQGIVSSRGIERVCREHVAIIALSVDSAPHFTTLAGLVANLGDEITTLFSQVLYRQAIDLHPAIGDPDHEQRAA